MARKLAWTWIIAVYSLVALSILYGVFRAIWESSERGFWFGFIAFAGVTIWAAIEISD